MISIIVPIYNAEKYLEDCIRSVLCQNFEDWELILIDDGSTDDSLLLANNYARDSRIKIIPKPNEGVTFTRWAGVARASGEWVMFLDADDMLAPGSLSLIAHELNEDVDIVTFGMQSISDAKEIREADSNSSHPESSKDALLNANKVLKGTLLSCVTRGVYKRNLVLPCKKIFCNGLRIAEDTMFNLNLVLNTNPRIKIIDSQLYCYRINPESVTRTISSSRFEAVKDAIDYLRRFEQNNRTLAKKLESGIAFRKLLLWSTFMFNPNNNYYLDSTLRKEIRKSYFKAYRSLYPYLKVYIFLDLFIGTKISQLIIKHKS